MMDPQARSIGVAASALLASTATLVCCVLPVVMVSLGAGAALVGLITAVPQLIWLSEHKPAVFGIAGAMLMVAGAFLLWARRLPCPAEPAAAHRCKRLRVLSHWLYAIALVGFAVGAVFAFVLPFASSVLR